METLRVGHLLHCYLNTTENWCYRLMRLLPQVSQQLITEKVKNEEIFPLPGATILAAPLARLAARDTRSLAGAVVHRLQKALLPLWRRELVRKAASLDVLHAHFANVGWEYLWLARRLSVPLAVSFYGFDYEWLPRNHPEWRSRYAELFRQADLFLVEGRAGRRKLVDMGCPPEKVSVLHLGIDPTAIPVFSRHKHPGELRLLQIATFSEKKGYDVTVRAFAAALRDCPNMSLTLVGNDPDGERAKVEKMVTELGIGDRVTIIDGVPLDRLYRFMADFQLFIHPSQYTESGNSEGGAPVVLLDAQATGLPVVATTHCDIPDEVIHEETGLLVPEKDVAGLAGGIARFYQMDDREYQEFCARARNHVEREYDVRKSAVQLRGIYGALVAGARGDAETVNEPPAWQ